MRKPKKSLRKKAKKVAKVKVVEMAPKEVLKVVPPPGAVPLVAVDPDTCEVRIVPVPVQRKKGWWESMFG